jgi:hypothetical protein
MVDEKVRLPNFVVGIVLQMLADCIEPRPSVWTTFERGFLYSLLRSAVIHLEQENFSAMMTWKLWKLWKLGHTMETIS